MKTPLIILSGLLLLPTDAHCQGQLNWSDYDENFSITVWSSATGGNELGNTAVDIPPGTAVYNGTPLGTGYEAGLYVGATPSAVIAALDSGNPIATAEFQTGGGWDYSADLLATVPGAPAGSFVYVAIAAWSTVNGDPTSYAAALAAGDQAGCSAISSSPAKLGGIVSSGPPMIPGTLAGLGIMDFAVPVAISPVPEPGTAALCVIGATALMSRLRKK